MALTQTRLAKVSNSSEEKTIFPKKKQFIPFGTFYKSESTHLRAVIFNTNMKELIRINLSASCSEKNIFDPLFSENTSKNTASFFKMFKYLILSDVITQSQQ